MEVGALKYVEQRHAQTPALPDGLCYPGVLAFLPTEVEGWLSWKPVSGVWAEFPPQPATVTESSPFAAAFLADWACLPSQVTSVSSVHSLFLPSAGKNTGQCVCH